MLRRPPRRRSASPSTTATASSSTRSPSTTATRATSASCTSMWPTRRRAPSTTSRRCARSGTTDEYSAPDKRAFYGLLPESISHEGYSSHPVHSYWDDFFALRGLKDAAMLAGVVGDDRARGALSPTLRDDFRRDLRRVDRAARWQSHKHRLSSRARPSSATSTRRSTAIAIAPGGELDDPAAGGARAHVRALLRGGRGAHRGGHRRRGRATRPTSCATSGRFVRLGERERALRRARRAARRPAAAGVEPVGRRSSGAIPRRRASSATCRTPGSAPASSTRCAACSPTSARRTARWCSPPACRRSG